MNLSVIDSPTDLSDTLRINLVRSCTYGPVNPMDKNCYLDREVTHMNSSVNFILDTVTVLIPPLAQTDHESKLFCFSAVGTTSVFTVVVERSFTIGNENKQSRL